MPSLAKAGHVKERKQLLMMLSNEDIRRALQQGHLKITPFHPKWVRAAGVTMHLGETLLRPLPGSVVDVKNGSMPEYEPVHLTADQPYELKPSEFILGATLQKVTVGASLGFMIEGRSTLARVGLTIVQT